MIEVIRNISNHPWLAFLIAAAAMALLEELVVEIRSRRKAVKP